MRIFNKMKKTMLVLAASLFCAGSVFAETKSYLVTWGNVTYTASQKTDENPSTLTGNTGDTAEGIVMKLTGNNGKDYSSGTNKVKVPWNGATVERTTIKLSNGAQNTVFMPEGWLATKVTFYSYVNHAADKREKALGGSSDNTGFGYRSCYWKEVAGTTYTAETGTLMNVFVDGIRQSDNSITITENAYKNPDAISFDLNKASSFTFNQAGEQVCLVLVIEAESAAAAPAFDFTACNEAIAWADAEKAKLNTEDETEAMVIAEIDNAVASLKDMMAKPEEYELTQEDFDSMAGILKEQIQGYIDMIPAMKLQPVADQLMEEGWALYDSYSEDIRTDEAGLAAALQALRRSVTQENIDAVKAAMEAFKVENDANVGGGEVEVPAADSLKVDEVNVLAAGKTYVLGKQYDMYKVQFTAEKDGFLSITPSQKVSNTSLKINGASSTFTKVNGGIEKKGMAAGSVFEGTFYCTGTPSAENVYELVVTFEEGTPYSPLALTLASPVDGGEWSGAAEYKSYGTKGVPHYEFSSIISTDVKASVKIGETVYENIKLTVDGYNPKLDITALPDTMTKAIAAGLIKAGETFTLTLSNIVDKEFAANTLADQTFTYTLASTACTGVSPTVSTSRTTMVTDVTFSFDGKVALADTAKFYMVNLANNEVTELTGEIVEETSVKVTVPAIEGLLPRLYNIVATGVTDAEGKKAITYGNEPGKLVASYGTGNGFFKGVTSLQNWAQVCSLKGFTATYPGEVIAVEGIATKPITFVKVDETTGAEEEMADVTLGYTINGNVIEFALSKAITEVGTYRFSVPQKHFWAKDTYTEEDAKLSTPKYAYYQASITLTIDVVEPTATDVTDKLVNPNFDDATYSTGWTDGSAQLKGFGTSSNAVALKDGKIFVGNIVEKWESGNWTGDLAQNVKELPAGAYKFTMGAYANNPGEAYVFANESLSLPLVGGQVGEYTTFVEIAEGADLKVGVKNVSGINWIVMDNAHLYYYGEGTTVDMALKADWKVVLAAVEEAKAAYAAPIEVEALDAAVAAAKIGTVQEYLASAKAVNEAIAVFKKVNDAEVAYQALVATLEGATADAPVDATGFIANPSFEDGVTKVGDGTGGGAINCPNEWEVAYSQEGWGDFAKNGTNPQDGANCFNIWSGTLNSVNLYQEVRLPAGSYVVSAALRTELSGQVTDQHVYVKIGEDVDSSAILGAPIGDSWNALNAWQTLSVAFSVENETVVTIGAASTNVGGTANHAGWFQIDNFRLSCTGWVDPALAPAVDSLNALIAEVEAYQKTLDLTDPMQNTMNNDLVTAIATAKAAAEAKESVDAVNAACGQLNSVYVSVIGGIAGAEVMAAEEVYASYTNPSDNAGLKAAIDKVYEIFSYIQTGMGETAYTIKDLADAVEAMKVAKDAFVKENAPAEEPDKFEEPSDAEMTTLYIQDYESVEAHDWTVVGGTGSIETDANGNKYFKHNVSGSGNRSAYVDFNASTALEGVTTWKVEFDAAIQQGNQNNRSQSSIGVIGSNTALSNNSPDFAPAYFRLVSPISTGSFGTTFYCVNGTDTITTINLEKGVSYHYAITLVDTQVHAVVSDTLTKTTVLDIVYDVDPASVGILRGIYSCVGRNYGYMDMDNIVMRKALPKVTVAIFEQNYESVEAHDWNIVGGTGSLETGESGNKYFKHLVNGSGNRSASLAFNVATALEGVDAWTLQFDAAILQGNVANRSNSGLAVLGATTVQPTNSYIATPAFFNIVSPQPTSGSSPTTFYCMNGTDTVATFDMDAATYHYTITLDGNEVHAVIEGAEATVLDVTYTVDIEALGVLSGIHSCVGRGVGNMTMDNILLTKTVVGELIANPTIEVVGNEDEVRTITLACTTAETTILYTLDDGEELTYSEPFTISKTTKITVYAVKGNSKSDKTIETIVAGFVNTPTATITAVNGLSRTITLASATEGASIAYRTSALAEVALTKEEFHVWDGAGADAQPTTDATTPDLNIGTELGAGAMVYGYSTVNYLSYADLTGAVKLVVEGTPGVQLRVLMNRVENEGALTEKNPVIGEDGKAEVDFTGMEYVHLNAIKTGWGSPAGTITKLAVLKASDEMIAYTEPFVISDTATYEIVAKKNGFESETLKVTLAAGTEVILNAPTFTKAIVDSLTQVEYAEKGLSAYIIANNQSSVLCSPTAKVTYEFYPVIAETGRLAETASLSGEYADTLKALPYGKLVAIASAEGYASATAYTWLKKPSVLTVERRYDFSRAAWGGHTEDLTVTVGATAEDNVNGTDFGTVTIGDQLVEDFLVQTGTTWLKRGGYDGFYQYNSGGRSYAIANVKRNQVVTVYGHAGSADFSQTLTDNGVAVEDVANTVANSVYTYRVVAPGTIAFNMGRYGYIDSVLVSADPGVTKDVEYSINRCDGEKRYIEITCATLGADIFYALGKEEYEEVQVLTNDTVGGIEPIYETKIDTTVVYGDYVAYTEPVEIAESIYFRAYATYQDVDSDPVDYYAEAGFAVQLATPVITYWGNTADGGKKFTIEVDNSDVISAPVSPIYYTLPNGAETLYAGDTITTAAGVYGWMSAVAKLEGYDASVAARRYIDSRESYTETYKVIDAETEAIHAEAGDVEIDYSEALNVLQDVQMSAAGRIYLHRKAEANMNVVLPFALNANAYVTDATGKKLERGTDFVVYEIKADASPIQTIHTGNLTGNTKGYMVQVLNSALIGQDIIFVSQQGVNVTKDVTNVRQPSNGYRVVANRQFSPVTLEIQAYVMNEEGTAFELVAAGTEVAPLQAFIIASDDIYATVTSLSTTPNGINTIDAAGKDVESVKYYTTGGVEISNPAAGVYIQRIQYTDGTSATVKVVVK